MIHFCISAGISVGIQYLIMYHIVFQNHVNDEVWAGFLFTWQFVLTHITFDLIVFFIFMLITGGKPFAQHALMALGFLEFLMQLFCGFFKVIYTFRNHSFTNSIQYVGDLFIHACHGITKREGIAIS